MTNVNEPEMHGSISPRHFRKRRRRPNRLDFQMGDPVVANMRKSISRLSCLVLGMQDFAALILARSMSGPVDSDALEKIRASCIINLKNLETVGLGVDDDAEIIGQAVRDIEQLIDATIADARKINDGN
jgi:hypothetical protein